MHARRWCNMRKVCITITTDIQNHHWIKILPSVRRKERARIIGYTHIAISDIAATIHRKWVPNIYIQIRSMSRKRNMGERKEKRKTLSKINSISFSLIARLSRIQKKIVFDAILPNICAYWCRALGAVFSSSIYRFFWINSSAHLPIRHAHARCLHSRQSARRNNRRADRADTQTRTTWAE